MNFSAFRTDLAIDIKTNSLQHSYYKGKKTIEVSVLDTSSLSYHHIYFENISMKKQLKDVLKKELTLFLKKLNLSTFYHILVVGFGNEAITADAIGPKVASLLPANAYFDQMGVSFEKIKLSVLTPGVMGATGIASERLVKLVVKEIKPDVILFIDACVCNDIKHLNHSIQITNAGITPGSGLSGAHKRINEKTLGIPVLTIGVPTAIEIKKTNSFLLSTSDIDQYVQDISILLADAIKELLFLA